MPSSNKTAHLGLNRFIGSDKPKMDDFNYDNSQIDKAVGDHIEDKVAHLTAGERTALANQKAVIGSYTGNGADEREIALEFAPAMGLVFATGNALCMANPSNAGQTYLYAGMFSPMGCTTGLSLNGSALQVNETIGGTVNANILRFNTQGVVYVYLAFRP